MTIHELKDAAERILATLPRAHYLKVSTIEAKLDPTAPTSYFDPSKFAVTISLANIAQAIGKAGAMTDAALEATIRALLYHEISHAMLTPPSLFRFANGRGVSSDMANVIEDERIETLLANYYHGVDFKANARAIIEYHAPKSFEEWVFYGLRLRKAPFGLKEMLKAFARFLKATASINASSMDGIRLAEKMRKLLDELRAIFDRYAPNKADGQQAQQGEQPQSSDGEEGEGQQAQKGEGESKGESDNESEGESPLDGEPEEGDPDELAQTAEQSEEVMGNACLSAKKRASAYGSYSLTIADYVADKDAKVGMLKAIIRNQGLGVATAPTIGGYNGKFNVHRYIKDQHLTLKWCDKTLDGGERESRKAAKKTLNLWLDQSGSFRSHDATINSILKALTEIESSRDDFEWRLIRMTEHFEIERNRDQRVSQSTGGNALPKDEIAKCYAETNGTRKELNIVLFDGQTGLEEAMIRDGWDQTKADDYSKTYSFDNLKVFDNKRTIFITERDNTAGIKGACPNAREIIEENRNYEGRLTANIVRAFDLLF